MKKLKNFSELAINASLDKKRLDKNEMLMKYDELTYRINGCAMKVHNTLGNGFQ